MPDDLLARPTGLTWLHGFTVAVHARHPGVEDHPITSHPTSGRWRQGRDHAGEALVLQCAARRGMPLPCHVLATFLQSDFCPHLHPQGERRPRRHALAQRDQRRPIAHELRADGAFARILGLGLDFDRFPGISQLNTSLHTPRSVFYLATMRIGCQSALATMLRPIH